jgi:hypothetical protein
MDKTELLDTIGAEHARWEAVLEEVDEARMSEAGVVGEWSVKDLIAHITWSERQMVGMLRARAFVGSELWQLSQDERNAAIFEQNRHRSLKEVREEARQVFAQLLEELEGLTEEEVHDPGRFPGMPAEVPPWRIIAGNTFWHYREHTEDIRAWLEKNSAL